MTPLTIKKAIQAVLKNADKPLHIREITRIALEHELIESRGKTPEATFHSQIAVDISRRGERSEFVRTAPATFGLREWLDRDDFADLATTESENARMRVPHFPVFSITAQLLPLLDGTPRAEVLKMKSDILERRGTQQENVDWTDPNFWIGDRLSGRSAEIAKHIWEGTSKALNPRHLSGHWMLINSYDLLEVDASGVLRLTEKGKCFLQEELGPTRQEIDVQEGLDAILGLVIDLGPANRSDLLPPFKEFAGRVSKVRADSSIKSYLWARLRNLIERGLIERVGRSYSATDLGTAWMEKIGDEESSQAKREKSVLQLIREQKRKVREEIANQLSSIDPFHFEHLVKALLEAMDYENVEVTSKSGDGGVDVVGRIQLGITEVIEVVQVKRYANNIQRSTMDALRGSLHRFNAVRGTIITTGGFARGTKNAAFEPGAPPITLIDGNRLIDLMIDHSIGVSKRNVELLELDQSAFVITENE